MLILFTSGRTDLQFNVGSEFCEETFRGDFINFQNFCQISTDISTRRRNIFPCFVLCELSGDWGLNYGRRSNNPTHYLLDHGDMRSL